MPDSKVDVAIIGAGLSGLTLALALHQQSVSVTVYESRPAPLDIGGAVMLSPNALRVLDALELYDIVKIKGYNFDTLEYRDLAGNLIETQPFGSEEKYGYRGLRIYRYVLIDELVAALKEKSVSVQYNHKFSHVVEDNDKGVTFAFTNGATVSCSLLVGADGIHSTVRQYLYPNLKTKFIGMAGITASVPTAQLKLPPGYHLPVTIMSPQGAFVIAPQKADGSEVLIGKQQRVVEGDYEGWDRDFVADKDSALHFLQQGNQQFPEIVHNAVSRISVEKVNKWPFFVVPKLERWASESRRVIIVGDAAHAIPPSAGQGINQAFEDVYMLALVLSQGGQNTSTQDALSFWQKYRQERVDKILELNKQIDKRRMPIDDRAQTVDREELDLGWLYEPDFKGVVAQWSSEHGKGE